MKKILIFIASVGVFASGVFYLGFKKTPSNVNQPTVTSDSSNNNQQKMQQNGGQNNTSQSMMQSAPRKTKTS